MQAKLNATTIKGLETKSKPFEVVDTEIKGFLLRVQPTGSMTYYFSYRGPSGARKRIKIGVASPSLSPAQARDEAKKLSGDVTKGIDVQREKKVAKMEAKEARLRTLEVFLEDQYGPWVLAHLKTGQATLNRIDHHFSKFMSLAIEEITVRRVENWRTKAQSDGLKPATINRTVNCLRGVLTKAVEWGLLDKHPLEKLKALKVDKAPKVRFLTNEEEGRLYAALAARDEELKAARERGNKHRASRGLAMLPSLVDNTYADRMTPMVTLSLKTGLRRGEMFDLMAEDVDLVGRVITVRGEDAKSGHTRHVPLSPKALETLTSWISQQEEGQGRVFPADDGGRLDNVRKSWASILSKAGISGFRWHDMRHDFASKLVMKGVPLNTVRELCGHADMNTTLRYAHLAPDHKSDAVALIG